MNLDDQQYSPGEGRARSVRACGRVSCLLLPLLFFLASPGTFAQYHTDTILDFDGTWLSRFSVTDGDVYDMQCYWDTIWQFGEEWPVEVCTGKETIEVRVNAWLYAPGGVPAGFVSNVGTTYADVSYLFNPGSNYGTWTAVAEHLAREQWFQSICFAPQVDPPFGVPRCQQFSMTFDEDLGTTQDNVQVDAPPPCVDPGYTPPPLQPVPTPTEVSYLDFYEVGMSYVVGLATAQPNSEGLECVQRCVDGQNVWRMEGDLVLDPYDIYVAEDLWPESSPPGLPGGPFVCPANPSRPSEFMANTTAHELIHANVYRDILSPFRDTLGSTYPEMEVCETALDSLGSGLAQAIASETELEKSHPNHNGERRSIVACLVEGPPTWEWWCGDPGNSPFVFPGTCPYPDGDFYPNPNHASEQ